ncbi:alpha/beta fold hydrolase [Rhodococcus koreensis]
MPAEIECTRFVTVATSSVTLRGDRWTPQSSHGTVLFLHGGGQTRHSWRRTAARVPQYGWTAVTMDLRGHGESDWATDGDYSTDAMVSDIVETVEQLGEKPVVVGASLGGLVGIVAEGEHQELFRGLVLVDVAPRVEPAGAERVMAFLARHRDGFGSLEEAAAAISEYNPHRKRSATLHGLRKNLRKSGARWYWHWDPAFLPDPPVRRTSESRVAEAAARVRLPVLAIRGSTSDVVSDRAIEHLIQLIPQTRVRTAAAGHMVTGDDNDSFSRDLEEFVGSLPDKTTGTARTRSETWHKTEAHERHFDAEVRTHSS